MIERERLKELIEEGKPIYVNVGHSAIEFKLNKKYTYIEGDYVWKYRKGKRYSGCLLKNLFETKEEAKFVSKYHTTRVERFEPPTYEEFIDEDFYFYWFIAKSTQRARICKKDNSIFVELGVDENLYEFQRNKEGYINAVGMAYKLFKGE